MSSFLHSTVLYPESIKDLFNFEHTSSTTLPFFISLLVTVLDGLNFPINYSTCNISRFNRVITIDSLSRYNICLTKYNPPVHLHYADNFRPFKYFHRQFRLIATRQFNRKNEKKRKKEKRKNGSKKKRKKKGVDRKFKKQRNSISLKTSVHAAKRLADAFPFLLKNPAWPGGWGFNAFIYFSFQLVRYRVVRRWQSVITAFQMAWKKLESARSKNCAAHQKYSMGEKKKRKKKKEKEKSVITRLHHCDRLGSLQIFSKQWHPSPPLPSPTAPETVDFHSDVSFDQIFAEQNESRVASR